MSNYNKYRNEEYNEDWSKGPRDRKDKPGKKHNNSQHTVTAENEKKKVVKTPQKFRRHCDDDEED